MPEIRMIRPALVLLFLGTGGHAATPQNFLFTRSDDLETFADLVVRPDIGGVQIVYDWNSLESAKGVYDFARIERDLAFLERRHKRLFLQIQDRFFEIGHRNVPDYLLEDPIYGGGLVPQVDNPGEDAPEGTGWVAMQWNLEVRKRYQQLLSALAERFDGRVAGVNLPETAVGVDIELDQTGFTCDSYFAAELENAAFARRVFTNSPVVLYSNFWPCEWNNDKKYMSRTFEFAQANGIGLGGPDIVPWRKAQMNNSYGFFNQYKGKLRLVAMAVQEPTLTYTNPKTGKKFTRGEFGDFAENHLGVNIIFWSTKAPWLRERSTP
jgi:hypothetical protein